MISLLYHDGGGADICLQRNLETLSMRVFVTGATGWVGSAIVTDLIAAGHQVLGLTRSEQGAAALAAAGAEIHRGSLEDLDSLRSGAAQAEGVIHTAFNHDFSKFAENGAAEGHAIEALGAALEGSDHPMVVTSGLGLLTPGRLATEEDTRAAGSPIPRDPEGATAQLVARGVRATVVRLPPSVHGHGDHGFVPRLITVAREKGVSAYLGEGLNRWATVHRLDAARVYRFALERGAEGGPFHAVAEEGVPLKAIAELIGRRLNIPIVSKSPQEAVEHFGLFAMFAGMDGQGSSKRTRSRLGWTPEQPGLLADIDHPAYFES
jgi:nucleoside-diphosphate-sugar epimerase